MGRKLIFRETYENLTGIPKRKDFYDGDFQRDIEGHFIPNHSHGLFYFPKMERRTNVLLFLESLVLFSESCFVDMEIFRDRDSYEAELHFGKNDIYHDKLSSLSLLPTQCDCCRVHTTENNDADDPERPSCTFVLKKSTHDIRLDANVLL